MKMNFYQSKKIGEQWESQMEIWMSKYFSSTDWLIEDARHVHRDRDGDQFPDYLLVNSQTDIYCFIDAKKRKAYFINKERYFGFDERFYKSYTNIARKHNTMVYIGFHDPKFDPGHVYVLNVNDPPDLQLFFDNEWGRGSAYRWKIKNLLKLEI